MAPTAIVWRPARKSASSASRRGPSPRSRWKLRSGANAAKSNTATATTATAEPPRSVARGPGYIGRFAPSPSGDLHLGSIYAAAASYLDARAHGGRWLVRLEDLDRPRVAPGADAGILATLQAFGFEWDGEVERQSEHTDRYSAALDALRARGLTFECSCSRAALADEARYPGSCRNGPLLSNVATATRLRVDPGIVEFTDRIQGRFRQEVSHAVGDVALRRRDGLFTYLLGVVVDDAAQGVTHVVRGADLLDNTPRQMLLQARLGLPTPAYAHVPVLTEPGGRKLAKSARSLRADAQAPGGVLLRLFEWLSLDPPPGLSGAPLEEIWSWGFANWRIEAVPARLSCALEDQ